MGALFGMANLAILIVEDHPGVLDSIERMVEQWPHVDVFSAEGFIAAAVRINATERLDLLLSDIYFPGEMNGVDVADLAVKTHPEVAVVLFSADRRAEIPGMRDNYEFMQKPFDREQLMVHIDNAFSKLHASAEWQLKLSTEEASVAGPT